MAVEAIFWFYLSVWWAGVRLTEMRERACDSPLLCASGVAGADLKKRIEAIMTSRFARKLNIGKKALLASAAALAITGPIIIGLMMPLRSGAQSSAGDKALAPPAKMDLKFEVASVKHSDPSRTGHGRAFTYSPGRFTAESISLASLAMNAYGVKEGYEMEWKSPWMGTEVYDVTAKVPVGATKEQVQIMLRQLLVERFGLVVHREARQLRGYRLVVAKEGAKLKTSLAASASVDAPGSSQPSPAIVIKNGAPQFSDSAGSGTLVTLAQVVFRGRHENMSGLAHQLVGTLHAPVFDATGLEGEFDYDLSFAPEPAPLPKGSVVFIPPGAGAVTGEASPAPPSDHPTLWTAIKQQLGLQLEAIKSAPIDVLVLDEANRVPTEN